MGLFDFFKPRGIVVKVIKGTIGEKKEPTYLILFTKEKGIVEVNKRKYYFLGFSEQSISEMSTAKALTGAAIGTVFAPGIGTLIGGAVGAKKKKKTNYTMAFMDVESKEKFIVEVNLFATHPNELNRLVAHDIAKEETFEDNSKGALSKVEAIREFKKLLDEGIITQEEFNKKKKELIG
ncbi:SHOCT domain-containing protein [Sutcliffiella sp. NC1]|uniref:SHOCT domain-containing protein n=1 Tax=Sutcliffiella sp. NC1 TaxID=3004096 RepID=UPI0022DDB249|nr:SHOCT domain-containing protein [Sutcliffiella sp. NC1]WBL16453.1 SHOCT domain-containing protein [Sutcliffiella sp. NC1]